MRTKLLKVILCSTMAWFAAFTWPRPAAAHHAFGSEFDANAPVLLKGEIAKIEWVNPHTWIHVEITKGGWHQGNLDGGGGKSQHAAAVRRE